MKANELRIENLVGCDISTLTVKAIYDETVICHKSNGMPYVLLLEDIYGLLITEEWLVKFGFKKEGEGHFSIGHQDYSYHLCHRSLNGFTNGGYFMGIRYDDWNKDPDSIFYFEGSNGNVKYVHQLQNLYFALTGEEFTIKE